VTDCPSAVSADNGREQRDVCKRKLPLLDRRGGCAIRKMMRSFQTRADGVVVQETSPEQPPRRFAPPLLSRRGNCPLANIALFIHTFSGRLQSELHFLSIEKL